MNLISDHLPIYLRHKKCREVKAFSIIWGRSMRNYNAVLFQSVITSDDRWRLSGA